MLYVEHMPQTDHMSVTDAAAALGVSRWTVLRLIHDEDNPLIATRLGDGRTSSWIVSRADVERRVRQASKGAA